MIVLKPRAADKSEYLEACEHSWTRWHTIGHTGDWFHPDIIKRACKLCHTTETDEI